MDKKMTNEKLYILVVSVYSFVFHSQPRLSRESQCVWLTRLCHLEAFSPKWSVQIAPVVSPSKLRWLG